MSEFLLWAIFGLTIVFNVLELLFLHDILDAAQKLRNRLLNAEPKKETKKEFHSHLKSDLSPCGGDKKEMKEK